MNPDDATFENLSAEDLAAAELKRITPSNERLKQLAADSPPRRCRLGRRVRVFFAWYDIWVGVFVDRNRRRIYICPIPCLVIMLRNPREPPDDTQ